LASGNKKNKHYILFILGILIFPLATIIAGILDININVNLFLVLAGLSLIFILYPSWVYSNRVKASKPILSKIIRVISIILLVIYIGTTLTLLQTYILKIK
jgi:hypothetical protein